MTSTSQNTEHKKLDQLREILLKDDRDELERVRRLLEEKDQLSAHISPIIEEHIFFLKNNFPDEFRNVVDKQIETKLKESQDDLIAVIYPAVGQMIRKYVAHQILLLRESIEDRINETKNSGIIGWIRRKIFRIKDSEWILAKSSSAKMEGIYIIEQGSGILLGSASVSETGDKDLLAGMLTAIQGFAEDAFMKGEQKIDIIEYDRLSVFLQSFPKFYIAVSIDGKLTAGDKDKLSTELFSFVNKKLNRIIFKKGADSEEEIRIELNEQFLKPQKLIASK